jgi:hypothetical protein
MEVPEPCTALFEAGIAPPENLSHKVRRSGLLKCVFKCSSRLGFHAALFGKAALLAAPFGPAPMGAGFRKSENSEHNSEYCVLAFIAFLQSAPIGADPKGPVRDDRLARKCGMEDKTRRALKNNLKQPRAAHLIS